MDAISTILGWGTNEVQWICAERSGHKNAKRWKKRKKKEKRHARYLSWEDERTWLGALHEGRKKGTAIYKARYHIEIRPAYDELKKSTTHER